MRPTGRRGRPKVALVIKRSKWDIYMEHPSRRLRELLAKHDPTVANLRASHDEHLETLAEVGAALEGADVEVVRITQRRLGNALDGCDLIVTVGGDGTLLHASHSVGSAPVLAINSSPSFSVGFFCGARKGQARRAIQRALDGTLRQVRLTRMQVAVNGKIAFARVLNDALFCHQSPAATSRYILEHRGRSEEQKSSGFWIGPAAGSTAAQRSAGGRVLPLSSEKLQLVVREPYTPHGKAYRFGKILVEAGDVLATRAKSRSMRLYLDGPENMVRLAIGDLVEFSASPEPLCLLGLSSRRH